ncbi:hypothetical protein OIU84_002633 [Salix udensis]|uniref:Uncharacterized protein n=1 Tax=Salix udensis TaxID=889485 RepID=A0AAD6K527_9ROSI|nr:hypothetical protein OIU84_002633 [Salix udensis]
MDLVVGCHEWRSEREEEGTGRETKTEPGEEGRLPPKGSDSLDGIQTLESKSSAEPGAEEASFNQVVALSQMGLILPANAKKNAIYVVHLDYGPNPKASTRLDYTSKFTVTMPILSLTGTSDVVHGQSVAQVYCVRTQAIQQYTLELCRCTASSDVASPIRIRPKLDTNNKAPPCLARLELSYYGSYLYLFLITCSLLAGFHESGKALLRVNCMYF